MSRKPNKQAKQPELVNPAVAGLDRKLRIVSIALIVCAVAKAVFVIFFDLSAITNFTGVMNPDRAVESGMGRICLAVSLVMFMAGILGLGTRTHAESALKNAKLIAAITIACAVATVVIGIIDGHNPGDIVCSLAGGALSALLWYYVRALER